MVNGPTVVIKTIYTREIEREREGGILNVRQASGVQTNIQPDGQVGRTYGWQTDKKKPRQIGRKFQTERQHIHRLNTTEENTETLVGLEV